MPSNVPFGVGIQPQFTAMQSSGQSNPAYQRGGSHGGQFPLASPMAEACPLRHPLPADMLTPTMLRLQKEEDEGIDRSTTSETHCLDAVAQADAAVTLTGGITKRHSTRSSENASGCITVGRQTTAIGLHLLSGSRPCSCRGRVSAAEVQRRSSSCASRWSSLTKTTIDAFWKSLQEECVTEFFRSPLRWV